MPPQPVYVADASAFVDVERIVPLDRQASVFIDLADLVEREQLVFCEQLVAEMERIGTKQTAHLFVKQGKDRCFHTGADYNLVKKLMRRFNLVDPHDRRENASPYVLAQASELASNGFPVTLVTEDFRRKPPPLVSLGWAADELGLNRIGVRTMLAQTSIWPR